MQTCFRAFQRAIINLNKPLHKNADSAPHISRKEQRFFKDCQKSGNTIAAPRQPALNTLMYYAPELLPFLLRILLGMKAKCNS